MNDSIAKFYTHQEDEPVRLETSCVFRGHLLWFIFTVTQELEQRVGIRSVHGAIVSAFLDNLANRLDVIARQTILFEKKLYQALTGAKSANYQDFTKALTNNPDRIINLLSQYPVLEHLLSSVTTNFKNNAVDFALALAEDYSDVSEKFQLPRDLNDKSVKIELTDGELHCNSRSIVIVSIDGEKAFAYKPRNLAAEAELTATLREFSSDLGFNTAWVLPEYIVRQEYGWVKWVSYREAKNESDVKRFYTRAGYLIGFSELFAISDLHNGNLIAHCDSPVPVDLEAALTPQLRSAGAEEVGTYGAWNLLGTGLLPSATWKGGDLVGIDTSGLGGLASQYCSMSVYQNTKKGELDEEFSEEGTTIEPSLNVLRLCGEIQKPWAYLDQLEAGYRIALTTIPKRPRAVAVLDKLAVMETRYIHQSTAGYHFALQASMHPCLLTDSQERRSYLISCLSATSSDNPELLQAEVLACEHGDVPRFVGIPSSIDVREPAYLVSSTQIPGACLSGIQNSAQMVASFSEERIAFGVRLLRGSIKALDIHYANGTSFKSSLLVSKQADVDDVAAKAPEVADFCTAARESWEATRRYIARQENSNGDRSLLHWYGCKTSPSGGMEFGQIGTDFYHGSSGILLAMQLLGRGDITDLLRRATRTAISELKRDITKLGGSYIGLASAILPLYAMISRAQDPFATELMVEAKAKFERAVESRHPMQYFVGSDLICGVAGALNVAAIMYSVTEDAEWRSLAEGTARILMAQVRESNGALVIPSGKSVSVDKDACLTGLSHGQIGIAVALSNYAQRCLPDTAHRAAVEDLIDSLTRWELSRYCEEECNWPDYRVRSAAQDVQSFEFGWSHGAPGIYLALMQLAPFNGAARHFTEAVPYHSIVASALRRRRSPVNVTICHGALGAVALSRRLLASGSDQATVNGYVEELISWSRLPAFTQMDREEFNLADFDMPGLWTGRAGAALGYASLADESLSVPFLIEDTFDHLNLEPQHVN